MTERKRSVPRLAIESRGNCRLACDPVGTWTACRIVDLSPIGVGIELDGAPPEGVLGSDAIVSIHLSGTVISCRPSSEVSGDARLGIAFSDLDPAIAEDVDELKRLGLRW